MTTIPRALRNGSLWLVMLALGALSSGCAGALRDRPGPNVGVPRVLEADVAAGYRAYRTTLERWGRWSADPLYAVRWCPSGVDPSAFLPYRSEGHWAASHGDASAWGAPVGSPYWRSNDSETWGDITMHHGWWVHVEEGAPDGAWCWIPGAAETAARVVWRSGDGFVGWAPEPPSPPDEDGGDDDDLAWSYELVATLLDDLLDSAVLTNDAADTARAATRVGRFDPARPGAPRHVGPSSDQVASARHALTSYVLAHPVVGADPARSAYRSSARSTSSGSWSSSGRSSTFAASSGSPSHRTSSGHASSSSSSSGSSGGKSHGR